MNDYLKLLQDLDAWFAAILSRYPAEMKCTRGCALCCHGLFDISLADASLLEQGLNTLSPKVLHEIRDRAAPIQSLILRLASELKAPFLLDEIPEARIDEIVEQAGSPPCPLLGPQQECLVYEHRPLACRLEGVPMVDTRDGLFGDWCELNFTKGVPPQAFGLMARDYSAMQEYEGRPRHTVFIASLLVQFGDL